MYVYSFVSKIVIDMLSLVHDFPSLKTCLFHAVKLPFGQFGIFPYFAYISMFRL